MITTSPYPQCGKQSEPPLPFEGIGCSCSSSPTLEFVEHGAGPVSIPWSRRRFLNEGASWHFCNATLLTQFVRPHHLAFVFFCILGPSSNHQQPHQHKQQQPSNSSLNRRVLNKLTHGGAFVFEHNANRGIGIFCRNNHGHGVQGVVCPRLSNGEEELVFTCVPGRSREGHGLRIPRG